MMKETRRTLKASAKGLLGEDQHKIIFLTVIYIFVTDWLTTVLELIKENPIVTVANAFADSVESLTEAAVAGGTQSVNIEPAYTAASQTAKTLLSQPAERTALFAFVLLFLYTVIMNYGYYLACMKHVRRQETDWQDLFATLYLAGRIILLELLVTALTVLGMACFLFPGLYFYYQYMMAPYCLLDHPEASVFKAMGRSSRMMRGHKLELFVCDLSFVGWQLVGMVISDLCAGLGSVAGTVGATFFSLAGATAFSAFLLPYRQLTFLQYYQSFESLQAEQIS